MRKMLSTQTLLHSMILAGTLGLSAPSQAQELKTINVMSPNEASCSQYPQFVGQDFGYFADEGLKVNLLSTETTIPFVAFLANGDADLVALDAGQILQAVQAGQDIAVVYEFMQYAPEGIGVLADGEIKSLDQLKGKTVGLASDRDRLTTTISLSTVGLDITDVETVVVGSSGPVLAKSLQDGAIQAFAGSSGDFNAIQSAGVNLKRLEPTELSQNPANSWVVWRPTLEEKRPLIQNFLKAWAKGQHSVLLDTKAVISACKKHVPEQFEDAAAGERRIMTNGFTLHIRRTVDYGELQTHTWESVQDAYIEVGEIEKKIDPATFLDSSFIAGVNTFTTEDVRRGIVAWKEANKDILVP